MAMKLDHETGNNKKIDLDSMFEMLRQIDYHV